MTSRLNFEKHISTQCNKSAGQINTLTRLKFSRFFGEKSNNE